MQAFPRSRAFDDYWKFAAKRHAAYMARAEGRPGPWTDDPVIGKYRFTNAYRAADRVSQFLIRDVQYAQVDGVNEEDALFRTLLFKVFNNIETWRILEDRLGPIRWRDFDFDKADRLLETIISSGKTIYSAAYIMPSPPFGGKRKHTNHLRLINSMMQDGLTERITSQNSLAGVYKSLREYPGLGPFLAFQFTIDINYTELIDFDENDFVVAGPGAHDGIRKCFPTSSLADAERIIFWMVENQDSQFSRLGIHFGKLFGRPLKAIDCQNIFCEISKYGRVAFPEVLGLSSRTRIKQSFNLVGGRPLDKPFFPPKWSLTVDIPDQKQTEPRQLSFESL